MSYWLIKTEPEEYSFETLRADGETLWTGIRNYQARNNINAMQPGDGVFVYHSGDDKEIVGVARVVTAAEPDPTADGVGTWTAIRLAYVCPVGRPINLEEIKNTHGLAVMPLATQSRLSVQPVTESQWNDLLKYTRTTLP